MTCSASSCWCRDPLSRWIPSMDVGYTVEELATEDNVRVFRYRYIERPQHEQA